jgi:dihydroneopterin aldolase/2-amino-4-hydroxy-6-hydroxymethyldihydropteridine diphosphokinase
MDEIRIDDLEVYAYHGVYPEEKKGQIFVVRGILYADLRRAGLEDDLGLSIHYGEVCYFISHWMQGHTCKLIEAAAENLARELLLNFPLICSLDLEIRKPQAPIELTFDSVSVKINRGWHKAYLAVGSNMGNKRQYIQGGLDALSAHPEIRLHRVSGLSVTKPYGGVEQEDFLNGALEIETLLTPGELLDAIRRIENAADRQRNIRWGPRTLDLDILFYDELIFEDEEMAIPHVDMQNRYFVLKPMAEIAPYFRHPILKKTMRELLMGLEEGEITR